MTQVTLLQGAGFAVLVAVVYAYVGWRLGQRKVSEDAKLAVGQFSVWWLALAGTTLLGGVQSVLAVLGKADLDLFVTITYLNIGIICFALRGLLFYLGYLFTGRRRILAGLTVFYGLSYVLLLWYLVSAHPTGVDVRRWSTTLTYEEPLAGPLFGAVVALLLIPQMVGAALYLTLYRKAQTSTQRYRILLVSLSILVWFGSTLAAASGNLSQSDSWQLASRFIGLGAAVAILLAYHPPPWVKRRYGLLSIGDEGGSGPRGPPAPEAGGPSQGARRAVARRAGRGVADARRAVRRALAGPASP
jgi:hypothetical protein